MHCVFPMAVSIGFCSKGISSGDTPNERLQFAVRCAVILPNDLVNSLFLSRVPSKGNFR